MSENGMAIGTAAELLPARVHAAPEPVHQRGIVIADMDGLARFAACVHASGIAPKGFANAQAIAVAIQMGLELGLTPMQSLQSIAVINGRPGIYGDAALALVRASGQLEWIEEACEGKDDDYRAVCRTKRRGDPQPRTTAFSIRDAKRAGLWGKAIWAQYPQRMLMFRARGFNLRDNFPDILRGFKTIEELADYPDAQAKTVAQNVTQQIKEQLTKPAQEPIPEPNLDPGLDADGSEKQQFFQDNCEAIAAATSAEAIKAIHADVTEQVEWLGPEAAGKLLTLLDEQQRRLERPKGKKG